MHEEDIENDGFLDDDTYDQYRTGQDLSSDPMATQEPTGWRARRKLKKEKQEQEKLALQREAIKAEILAELKAEQEGLDAEEEPTDEKEAQPEKRSKLGHSIMAFLSGNILSKTEVRRVYPYLLFIAFLAFLYIGNVFRMQHLYRKHDRLATEVKELRAKSMTIASEKMNATRQSHIISEIKRRGLPLRESLEPNHVIERR